jgi:FAD/FMN-containing dehydrogenase
MRSVVDALTTAFGENTVLSGHAIGERYLTDWSRVGHAAPLAVVLPRSTDDVSRILKICHAAGQTVVPQGGLTGLAGGAIPNAGDVCLSLERLTGVESIDGASTTMTVRAGTTLQQVQEAATENGFEFSLDMGSRGSCQIGGAIATNAGGVRVIQSGTARDQVLGLEVVLADGTVLDSMNQMIKNNTGYDLKHWFIGSEGTLGVITRAVLRLRPPRKRVETALCALTGYTAVLRLLSVLRDGLSAFEVMWEDFFEFGAQTSPFNRRYPVYALVETMGSGLADRLDGIVADAVLAHSTAEARALWEIREAVAAFVERCDPLNFDVSLPIARIGAFVEDFKVSFPGSFFFGHIGDSNLHVTVDRNAFPGVSPEAVDRAIYSLVESYRGSVSAEHGIGILKREFLRCSRTEAEIRAMWAIRKALDPKGILNPGKVLPEGLK